MENVRFKEKGKWADVPSEPILEVEADSVHQVSDNLAKVVVDAGKGERVTIPKADKEEKSPKPKRGRPPQNDKDKAESA